MIPASRREIKDGEVTHSDCPIPDQCAFPPSWRRGRIIGMATKRKILFASELLTLGSAAGFIAWHLVGGLPFQLLFFPLAIGAVSALVGFAGNFWPEPSVNPPSPNPDDATESD
jgi:hypothetical protein